MAEATLVLPVLVSAEHMVVQTTSGRVSPDEIWVHCFLPPRVGARASMAIQFPDGGRTEVMVGEVIDSTRGKPEERSPGFRARFVDLPSAAKRRLASTLQHAAQQHRAFPRLPANLRVMAGATAFRVRNISAVGMFVEHLGGAGPGDAIELRLDLGDESPAVANALVIHALDEGAGVQFVDSSREFRLRLDKYVASLAAPSA
jgi:hypothetical protein